MSLEPCKSCGHMVAYSAKTCPQCGASLRDSGGFCCSVFGYTLAIFVVLGAILYLVELFS